jgi:hypothetical protein
MGESDVYCAFCSGPMLKSRIEFSRRQIVAPARKTDRDKTHLGENAKTNAAACDDEESIGSDDDEDESSESEDDRTAGYNPDVLSQESVGWVGECRCLALNMDRYEIDGVGRAFVSGHGSPDGLGYFNVHQRGSGNIPGKHRLSTQLTSQTRMILQPLSIRATTPSTLGKRLLSHSTTRAMRSLRAVLGPETWRSTTMHCTTSWSRTEQH